MRAEVVTSTSELRRKFRKAGAAVNAALEAAVAEAAMSVRDDAQRFVPVGDEPPHIRDHIVVEIEGATALVGVFEDEFYYGQFLEMGTSEMPAQPFMLPAAELERKRFKQRIEDHVEKAV